MIKELLVKSFVKGTAKTTASILVIGLVAGIWYTSNYAYNSYMTYCQKQSLEEEDQSNNKNVEDLEMMDVNEPLYCY